MSTPESKALISLQVKSLNELHQRIVGVCWAKCITRPKEQDLTVGETACVDRCVPKYIEAHQLIGKDIAEARGSAPLFP
jgi:mitochondrial import inner membrane translocase subunit TIM10